MASLFVHLSFEKSVKCPIVSFGEQRPFPLPTLRSSHQPVQIWVICQIALQCDVPWVALSFVAYSSCHLCHGKGIFPQQPEPREKLGVRVGDREGVWFSLVRRRQEHWTCLCPRLFGAAGLAEWGWHRSCSLGAWKPEKENNDSKYRLCDKFSISLPYLTPIFN